MSAIPAPGRRPRSADVPLLRHGERLTQAEFHRRYEAYPEDVKFELIGGVVYMASPLGCPHGEYHADLSGPFWVYRAATPGVQLLDNTTSILGHKSEPQPDLTLRVRPAYGGQTKTTEDNYVEGAAELIAEVAHSSRDIDLKDKLADYKNAGVTEYLVVSVGDLNIHWYDFRSGRPIRPGRGGVMRSRAFPGLWIDGKALLEGDSPRVLEVIQQGIASRPHAAFVRRLAAARKRLERRQRPSK